MLDNNKNTVIRIIEQGVTTPEGVVLGRDIRTHPGMIADYCLVYREPVFENLTTLVEAMAYSDRVVLRQVSKDWKRNLTIVLPVYERARFEASATIEALRKAAEFLTGDVWRFEFTPRLQPLPRQQGHLTFPCSTIRHVVPFSDGLDSFAQAQLSAHEFGARHIMLVRAGLSTKGFLPNVLGLRVPRSFGGARLRETTYRTRPLVFFTMAAIAAAATDAEVIAVGENGQGAIGPACVPFCGEWWFRSAHPGFIALWNRFLNLTLRRNLRFEQPQVWKTKAEVLTELREKQLDRGWHLTQSCSGRPVQRLGRHGCGFCGGCLLRAVAGHAAEIGVVDRSRAFDVFASCDGGRDRSGNEQPMKPPERAVAVRAIGAMHDFARLSSSEHGEQILSREARWIDPERPDVARRHLDRLQKQHCMEWENFISDLPSRSWVRDIVRGL